MDNEEAEGSPSLSLNDSSRPLKRQKLDTSVLSNSNTSGNELSVVVSECDPEHMKRKFVEFRSQLDQTEAAVIQYNKIRVQSEELFRKERSLLEMQLRSEEKELSQLQEDLKSSTKDTQEARKAQTSAEAIVSQLKIAIGRHIKPLMKGSNPEDTPPVSLDQEINTEAQKTPKPAGEKVIEMEKTLVNDSIPQEELNPEDIQLEEALKEMEALEAKANRAEKLEKELQIAGDTVSSLHEALEKQESSIQEKSNEVEKLQQQVNMLQDNLSLSAIDNNETLSDRTHDDDSATESEAFGIDQESVTPEDDSKLLIGGKYPFLALNPEFVEIDWDKEFTRKDKSTWACKSCPHQLPSKVRMQDHVWTVHYRGQFQCPRCPTFSPRRTNIMYHIKKTRHI